MAQLPYSAAQIEKILDGRFHSPIQDVVGTNYTTGSRLAMSAATEYDFICNGATRNYMSFPDHITNIWNTSTNIATFPEFMNTVEMVANVSFNFDPTVAAAGVLTLRVYVNETVPLVMKQYTAAYKNADERYTVLATFYTGDDTGFDVKNKGVKFTIEASGAGELYDPSIEIYRT